TLSVVLLPPPVPQPNENVGTMSLYTPPSAPIEPGEFTIMRPALITSPNFWMTASLLLNTTAVCPRPPLWLTSTQTFSASSTDLARYTDSTGKSFSYDSGCPGPTP